MISQKLIDQIHQCADRITTDLTRALQSDPRCEAYRSIPHERLISLKDDLYRNLGRWLSSRSKAAVESRYARLGRERYLEGIPLAQLIYALKLTKSMLLSFLRGCVRGEAQDLSLEYELALAISEFFDEAIYFAAIGYDDARRAGLRAPAAAETVALPGDRKGRPAATEGAAADLDLPLSRGGDVGEVSG